MPKCPLKCLVGHPFNRCFKFRSLPVKEKWDLVMENSMCSKCLNSGHVKRTCTSTVCCRSCNGNHHSLLHMGNQTPKSAVVNNNTGIDDDHVLLATAVVQIKSFENKAEKTANENKSETSNNLNDIEDQTSSKYLIEDYVSTDSEGTDTKCSVENIPDDMKDDNLPPLSWKRGRVIRAGMSSDGLCKMVDVRTSIGDTERSIHNVCPFPTHGTENKEMDKPSSSCKEPTKSRKCKRMDNPFLLKNNSEIRNKFNINVYKNKKINSPVSYKLSISSTNKTGIFFEEVAIVGLVKTTRNVVVHTSMSENTTAKAGLDEARISSNKSSLQDVTSEVIKEKGKSVFQNIQILSSAIRAVEEAVNQTIDTLTIPVTVTNMLASLEGFETVQNGIIGALLCYKDNILTQLLSVNKFNIQIKDITARSNSNLGLHNFWKQPNSLKTWICSVCDKLAAEIKSNKKSRSDILEECGILRMKPSLNLSARMSSLPYAMFKLIAGI